MVKYKLKDLFNLFAGGDIDIEHFSQYKTPVHCFPIYSNSLNNKGLYGYTSVPKYKGNSITITGRGSVGHAECRKQDFDAIIRLLVLIPKKSNIVNPYYLTQFINQYVSFPLESTGVPQLTVPQIENIEVALPDYTQQVATAEALSDIDSLLSSLQKLIEKKKAIKQGAMQELLTGQKRLPGFSVEWSYKSLGILGDLSREVINPQSLSETSFYEYSMPAYDNGRQPEQTSGKSMHSSRLKIYGEIILFNKLNVRQRRVWHVKECLENAVCSSEFLPYHSLEVHSEFLYQVLLCDKTTVDFENMSTGTSNSQKRITPSDFLEYEIALPEKDEQEAIAQVLSDMDSEIELLEKKLAKYQQIKQGMMQELLTGRIRLKEGENNA